MKIGAKVVFKKNFNTKVGISHHTTGIVVGIVKFDNKGSENEVVEDIILVEVESYCGGHGLGKNKKIIPVVRYGEYNTKLRAKR